MSIPGLWISGDRDGWVPARESRAILKSIIEEYDKDFSILCYPDVRHDLSAPMSEVIGSTPIWRNKKEDRALVSFLGMK